MSKRTKALFVIFLVLACPTLSRTAAGASHEVESPPNNNGGGPSTAEIPAGVSAELERLLLAADWKRVVGYLKTHQRQLPDNAELRAISGHACLAINANDVSLVMFRSLGAEADKLAWKRWTEQFLHRNPSAPVARYLHGDALARLGDWDGAIQAYAAGLDTAGADSSVIALLHNARGVARGELRRALAARGPVETSHSARLQWEKQVDDLYQAAEADFEKACASAPSLADPRANLGCLKLLRKTYDAAVKDFDLALKESPGFSLAQVGKASALMGMGQKSEEEAEKLYVRALDFLAVADLAAANVAAIQDVKLATLAAASAEEKSTPGATATVTTKTDAKINRLAGDMQRILKSNMTAGQKEHAWKGLSKQYTPREMQQAWNLAQKNIATTIQTLAKKSGSEANAYKGHATTAAYGKGIGDSAGQSKQVLGLLGAIDPVSPFGKAANATARVLEPIRIAADAVTANASKKAKQDWSNVSQTSKDLARQGEALRLGQRFSSDPKLNSWPRVYSVPPSVQTPRTATMIAGRIPNTAERVHIVGDPNSRSVKAAQDQLIKQGFRRDQIDVVPKLDPRRTANLRKNEYTLNFGDSAKKPGGVSMNLGRDRNTRRDWPVQTWFGLAQATPLPAIERDTSGRVPRQG